MKQKAFDAVNASTIQGEFSGLQRNKTTLRQKKQNRLAWSFITPMLIYYIIFTFIPIAFTFFLCFMDWNGISWSTLKFAGFNNFIALFEPTTLQLIWNTILMGIIMLVGGMILGFLIANIFVMKIRGMYIFRTIWYLPVVVSMAVISQIFSMFLNPVSGLFNEMLMAMGFDGINWKDSTFWMFFWIITISMWKGLGGTVIYFMAGLNAVPVELYEAAAVDGVNKRQRMWYITIPMIKPMTSYVFITGCIGMFGTFEAVKMISGGGPNGSTRVIMFMIYDVCYGDFRMGLGAAISVVLLFIVLILTIINMKITGINIAGERRR